MTPAPLPSRLQVPQTLQDQLLEFRRRVWTTKLAEAIGFAVWGVMAAYLAVFALDRLWDTPGLVRAGIALLAIAGLAIVPFYLYRWVWRRRRLDQLAQLLARRVPRVGDQLLGVIELAHSEAEQSRSLALCHAAIEQVAADARQRDLCAAAPTTRHRLWTGAAAGGLLLAIALATTVPAAARNAWARLLAPLGDVPRYTFAAFTPLQNDVVVPHGEASTLSVSLAEESLWQPAIGQLEIDGLPPLESKLADGKYRFSLPPLLQSVEAAIRVGDAVQAVRIEPKLRPELTALAANVMLPDYLGRRQPLEKDVRGGAVTMVRGSRATFVATASRELAAAAIDGQPHNPNGSTIRTQAVSIAEPVAMQLEWQDRFGLRCKEPFTIAIAAAEDEAPLVSCDGLPRRAVVLDSEQLPFEVTAHDDYGVREIGMEWRSVGHEEGEQPSVHGEQLLGAGGCEQNAVTLKGAFTAKSLGIQPQPIELRLFATDYYPDRPRTYSSTYLLFVLSPEEHAAWITEQLSRWHRQSLEVRDRELRLYEINKQLRELSPEALDQPQVRREVENQAAAERANGRRLASLSQAGEQLLRQAARNPEIGVGHLDRWAEMLEILQDISANRMPSVADLLKEASQVRSIAARMPAGGDRVAGRSRASGGGQDAEAPKGAKPPAPGMQLVDMESTQQPPDLQQQVGQPPKKNPTTSSLRLPTTTVMGQPSKKPASSAAQKVDDAVREQRDLLAEFEKVADELNTILANMEGSTLVKRLKAASRKQYRIAGDLSEHLDRSFGSEVEEDSASDASGGGGGPPKRPPSLNSLADEQFATSHQVSYIMDDMEAFFERRRLVRFKTILDDMRKEDVVGNLRRLGDDVSREQGLSIAQSEYWSDALDRWAEDLVDPACSGACPGCRSKGSLPPSIVLEVLKILEGEINLREETRVAEQARPAVKPDRHQADARRLANSQVDLQKRIFAVVQRILELPDAEAEFAYELDLLSQVDGVMQEAAVILDRPETGSPAIAAETEAIELLLKSKRINPTGGGGGGATPGGGGSGDTKDSALALLGAGLNQKEVRRDPGTSQAVGESGASLPEEFRAGLDRYFIELESGPERS